MPQSIVKEPRAEYIDNADASDTDDDDGIQFRFEENRGRSNVSGCGRLSAEIRLAAFFIIFTLFCELSEDRKWLTCVRQLFVRC